MSTGQWGPDESEDQVIRLHAFEDRHRDVIITRPNVVPIGGRPESWRAHRLGAEIASGDYLRYFLDDLDALGLPEVIVSQS